MGGGGAVHCIPSHSYTVIKEIYYSLTIIGGGGRHNSQFVIIHHN